jgi:hypothetical protein
MFQGGVSPVSSQRSSIPVGRFVPDIDQRETGVSYFQTGCGVRSKMTPESWNIDNMRFFSLIAPAIDRGIIHYLLGAS